MRRDFDLIREILLHMEATLTSNSNDYYYVFEHPDREGVAHSLHLMKDRGLVQAEFAPTMESHDADSFGNVRLTWEGHDFLDSIRDEKIWSETKAGAKAAGGFTFDLLKSLAKGLIKQKIETHTGVELDI